MLLYFYSCDLLYKLNLMTLVSLTYCTRFLASTSSNPCCSRTLIIDVLPKLLLTPTSSLKRTKPLIHDQIRSYTKDNEPNTSRRNERPSIYQLEHVQKRLEFTVLYKAIKIYISNFFRSHTYFNITWIIHFTGTTLFWRMTSWS